jgi:hypothetical protein
MAVWLRVREWFADRFASVQYPRQQYIPRIQPLGYQLLPEQRLLLGVLGGAGALVALAVLGFVLFLAGVAVFG